MQVLTYHGQVYSITPDHLCMHIAMKIVSYEIWNCLALSTGKKTILEGKKIASPGCWPVCILFPI